MAEWGAKSFRTKKNCELCEKLANPANYPKGAKVRIAGIYDCENCPVMKAMPIPENENIVELYNAIPIRYDPITGARIISTSDIKFVFDIFEVPEELRYDYYTRLMFFFQQILKQENTVKEKESKNKQDNEAWRKTRLQRYQPKNLSKITH